jgi:hypothetical protein
MIEHVFQDDAAALRRCQLEETGDRRAHRLCASERVLGLEFGIGGEMIGGLERVAAAMLLVAPDGRSPGCARCERATAAAAEARASATARSRRARESPGRRPRRRRPSPSCGRSSAAARDGCGRRGRGTGAGLARARR